MIANKFITRNSHQIKNRFISLLAEKLHLRREKIRELINKNLLAGPISIVLENLLQKKQIKNELEKEIASNEEKTSLKSFQSEKDQAIDQYINFGSESDIFNEFD